MAITVGATVSTAAGSTSSPYLSFSHTVDSGRNAMLVVAEAAWNNVGGFYDNNPVSCIFAGRHMQQFNFQGNAACYLWILRDPPIGASTGQLSHGVVNVTGGLVAFNLYGTEYDQESTSSGDAQGTFNPSATTITLSSGLTYLTSSIALTCVTKLNTNAITALNSQTVLATATGTGITVTAAYQNTGATSYTSGWSWSGVADNSQEGLLEIRTPALHIGSPGRTGSPGRVATPTRMALVS